MIRRIRLSGATAGLLRAAEKAFGREGVGRILQQAGERAAVKAESIISPYPPASGKPLERVYVRERVNRKTGQTETYLSKFASLRQQKKVMSLAAAGKIPYRRTGKLQQSMTARAKVVSVRRVEISVGSNRVYAPFVIGEPGIQSRYHAGNWTPLARDIDVNLKPIRRTFMDGVETAVRDELNRRSS